MICAGKTPVTDIPSLLAAATAPAEAAGAQAAGADDRASAVGCSAGPLDSYSAADAKFAETASRPQMAAHPLLSSPPSSARGDLAGIRGEWLRFYRDQRRNIKRVRNPRSYARIMQATYERAGLELRRILKIEGTQGPGLIDYFSDWRNFYRLCQSDNEDVLKLESPELFMTAWGGPPTLYHGTSEGLLKIALHFGALGSIENLNLDIDGIGDEAGKVWFTHPGPASLQRPESTFTDTLAYAGRTADPLRAIGLYYALRERWLSEGISAPFPPFADFTRRAIVALGLPLLSPVEFELRSFTLAVSGKVPLESGIYLFESDLPVRRSVKLFPGDDMIARMLLRGNPIEGEEDFASLAIAPMDLQTLHRLMNHVARRWKPIVRSQASERTMEDWEVEFSKVVCAIYRIHWSTIHSWSHTLRVVENAARIARMFCPDHMKAAITAAYLHDVGRVDDRPGTEHAIEGARIARRHLPEALSETEQESIVFAIAHHADRRAPNGDYPVTSNFPEIGERGLIERVIAALWDADRLDLTRLKTVDERYLSSGPLEVISR